MNMQLNTLDTSRANMSCACVEVEMSWSFEGRVEIFKFPSANTQHTHIIGLHIHLSLQVNKSDRIINMK